MSGFLDRLINLHGVTVYLIVAGLVVAAAILGDSVGYLIGDRYGTRLLSVGPLAGRRERIDAARQMLARGGGPALLPREKPDSR